MQTRNLTRAPLRHRVMRSEMPITVCVIYFFRDISLMPTCMCTPINCARAPHWRRVSVPRGWWRFDIYIRRLDRLTGWTRIHKKWPGARSSRNYNNTLLYLVSNCVFSMMLSVEMRARFFYSRSNQTWLSYKILLWWWMICYSFLHICHCVHILSSVINSDTIIYVVSFEKNIHTTSLIIRYFFFLINQRDCRRSDCCFRFGIAFNLFNKLTLYTY